CSSDLERGRTERVQLRARRRGRAVPPLRRVRARGAEAGRGRPAAACLRAGVQGLALVQPAGRAPRHLGDRAPALHPARAHPGPSRGPGLLRPAREARLPGTEDRRVTAPPVPAAASKTGTSMSKQLPLLIELGTEELPVKALPGLAQAFFDGVVA